MNKKPIAIFIVIAVSFISVLSVLPTFANENYTWIEEKPTTSPLPKTFSDSYPTSGSLGYQMVHPWYAVSYSLALFVNLYSTTPSNQYMRVGRNPVGTQTIYYSKIKEGQYYTHSGSGWVYPIYGNYYYDGTLSYTGEVVWYWN